MARFPGSDADLESAGLLKDRVAEALGITEHAESILRLQIERVQQLDGSNAWPRVQGILATRIADDLRAAAGLVLRGYFAQAMTLGASVYELSYTAAFIGTDNDRAKKWLGWDLPHRTPWPLKTMVAAVRTAVYGPDASADDGAIYMSLCWGKHGNPRLLRALDAAATPEAHVLNVDPALGGKAHRLGELALWTMLRPTITYLLFLHVSEQLGPDALVACGELIDIWKPFDSRIWPREN